MDFMQEIHLFQMTVITKTKYLVINTTDKLTRGWWKHLESLSEKKNKKRKPIRPKLTLFSKEAEFNFDDLCSEFLGLPFSLAWFAKHTLVVKCSSKIYETKRFCSFLSSNGVSQQPITTVLLQNSSVKGQTAIWILSEN